MDQCSIQSTDCHVKATRTTTGGYLLSAPVSAPSRSPGLGRRLVQLYCGLVLYGVSCALQLRAGLGLAPWDVLNQGVARHTGLSIGTVVIAIGALVLLLWIPLRQRPGLGTVSNVLMIGLVMDATLSVTPTPHSLWIRVPLLLFSVALCAVATGLYITPRFGPGPRDGLMTGLHRRTGRSVRLVRTLIEVAVLATGFALGGSVGVGTVLFAVGIGPLAQFFLRFFAPAERRPTVPVARSAAVPETPDPARSTQDAPDPV
ncbi:membrane protein YczE [Streptomyces abikoensis]|uniref:membrane protein YczE n=1 Tax=Streptomyces abikoensis TaxID=97398 RepID=UPI003678BA3B